MSAVAYRVRHGIISDAFGFRALRSWNDGEHRQWLGPWRTSDNAAQIDADRGSTEFRAFASLVGAVAVDRQNPDLGLWLPAPELAR